MFERTLRFVCFSLGLMIVELFARGTYADVRFSTDAPSTAARLTITVFDAAGTGFPIVVDLDRSIIGKPNSAQLKASAIVSEITAASAGAPINSANNRYKKPNPPFPFTAMQRFSGNPPMPDVLLTIKGTRRVMIGPDNTGEALDKIGPQGNGILTAMAFGGAGTATGENASGGASMVQAGIDGQFIATVDPTAGETFPEVLDQLATDLNENDIFATIDSFGDLSLIDPLPDNEAFAFGNTDTGFADFAIAAELPEPPVSAILGVGLAMLVGRWRRARTLSGSRLFG